MHGFALNCDCDLSAYDRFVPCGITDAGTTSLSVELGRRWGSPTSRQRRTPATEALAPVAGQVA